MKFGSVKRFPYRAKVLGYTSTSDSAGNVTRNYSYRATVNITGGISQGSSMTFYSDEYIDLFEHLTDILDASGEKILDNLLYEVRTVQPVLNAYGYREGFRASAVRL